MIKLKVGGELIEFKNWSAIHSEYCGPQGKCGGEHCHSDCEESECDCIFECAQTGLSDKHEWKDVTHE